MKTFCSFQNVLATRSLIHSDLLSFLLQGEHVTDTWQGLAVYNEAIPIAIYLCCNDTEVL